MNWERAPYGAKAEFIDVSGLGRYLIRPVAKRSQTWRAYLNGGPTAYFGSRDDCKAAVERSIRQRQIIEGKTDATS